MVRSLVYGAVDDGALSPGLGKWRLRGLFCRRRPKGCCVAAAGEGLRPKGLLEEGAGFGGEGDEGDAPGWHLKTVDEIDI